MARPSKDYPEKRNVSAIQVDPLSFKPSTLDEASTPPHLSVWVDDLTTPKQAYSFLDKKSSPTLVLRLKVEEVCKIVGISSAERKHLGMLKVIWVHLFSDPKTKKTRDLRLGAEGHSGITGLEEKKPIPEGLTKQQEKNLRKDLRSKLAELASSELLDE